MILEFFSNLKDSVILFLSLPFLLCPWHTTFLSAEAPLGHYFQCHSQPGPNFSAVAQRRTGKMEINEINSLVTVRMMLQNKRTCYSLKAFFKLNTILQPTILPERQRSGENQ